METIEVGAVLVDPERARITAEFQSFVRPVRTSELSAFCVELTGIQQRDVETAETFPGVLARWCAWVGDPSSVRLASWGDYDKHQLERDCAWHGVSYPFASDHFNVKRFWTRTYRHKPAALSSALERMGLEPERAQHRGLDDARSAWRILDAHTGGDLTGIV